MLNENPLNGHGGGLTKLLFSGGIELTSFRLETKKKNSKTGGILTSNLCNCRPRRYQLSYFTLMIELVIFVKNNSVFDLVTTLGKFLVL